MADLNKSFLSEMNARYKILSKMAAKNIIGMSPRVMATLDSHTIVSVILKAAETI
jgi:hypothetical protein